MKKVSLVEKAYTKSIYIDDSKYNENDIQLWQTGIDLGVEYLESAIEEMGDILERIKTIPQFDSEYMNLRIDKSVREGVENWLNKIQFELDYDPGKINAYIGADNITITSKFSFEDIIYQVVGFYEGEPGAPDNVNEKKEQWAVILENAAAKIRGSK